MLRYFDIHFQNRLVEVVVIYVGVNYVLRYKSQSKVVNFTNNVIRIINKSGVWCQESIFRFIDFSTYRYRVW